MFLDEVYDTSRGKYYVYLHKKPTGEVFYIGKGCGDRAHQMSPSRRTIHHQNIVKKYGIQNIEVQVIPCMYEEEAHMLERAQIMIHRANGSPIINLTDGGEGVSGRRPTAAQLAGLAKGRYKGKSMSDQARGLISVKSKAYHDQSKGTPEYQAWIAKLVASAEAARNRFHPYVCAECGVDFQSKSHKARCCSRKCEQRNRRARQAACK